MGYYIKNQQQSAPMFGGDGVSSYKRMGMITFVMPCEVWDEHSEQIIDMLSTQIADTAIVLTRYREYHIHFGSRDSASMFRLAFAEYIA